MADLVAFAQRVKDRLRQASREPHWSPGEADRYMAEVTDRRQRFTALATRLMDTVIQPRLRTLAGFFDNISFHEQEPAGRCSCWFGYCERFPTSTRVAFSVEHDVRFESVAVCFEATMMPLFIKLNDHDRLTLGLDAVDDNAVALWVETRLLEFLEDYLRLDRGRDDFEEEPVTDPVCGMRINRSSAAASDHYYGHPYFFCSKECLAAFAREPAAYVQVKTM